MTPFRLCERSAAVQESGFGVMDGRAALAMTPFRLCERSAAVQESGFGVMDGRAALAMTEQWMAMLRSP